MGLPFPSGDPATLKPWLFSLAVIMYPFSNKQQAKLTHEELGLPVNGPLPEGAAALSPRGQKISLVISWDLFKIKWT